MYSTKSLLDKTWELKDFDDRQSLMISQRHNVSLLIAKLLNIRNIPEKDIYQFLYPELLDNLPDPYILKDMTKSIERISETIFKKIN